MRRTARAIPLIALLALPACASSGGDYPSLAIRDAERATGSLEVPAEEPVTPPAPPPPLSSDVIERLAQLRASATEAHRDFTASVPAAERAVRSAAGAGVASDAWATAQVALANLESARSQTAIPLADLDLIYADAALELDLRQPIVAAREDVAAMVAEEDAVLERLRARLGG